MTDKAQLRRLALGARSALGTQARAAKSAAILSHLLHWEPFCRANRICLYASFGSEVQTTALLSDENPPAIPPLSATSIAPLPAAAIARHPSSALPPVCSPQPPVPPAHHLRPVAPPAHRQLCLPRVEEAALVLHRISLESASDPHTRIASGAPQPCLQLVRSQMGMPEPPASLPVVPPTWPEVILVPGSAFCRDNGHRLGYGKGFYDRLLPQAPQALKIGLCFDAQLFPAAGFPVQPHDIALDALVSESGVLDFRPAATE